MAIKKSILMFPIIQRVTLGPFQNDDFMDVSELITAYRQ